MLAYELKIINPPPRYDFEFYERFLPDVRNGAVPHKVEDVFRHCQQCYRIYPICDLHDGEILEAHAPLNMIDFKREGYCNLCKTDILEELKSFCDSLNDRH